jgi:hypothetical protein
VLWNLVDFGNPQNCLNHGRFRRGGMNWNAVRALESAGHRVEHVLFTNGPAKGDSQRAGTCRPPIRAPN